MTQGQMRTVKIIGTSAYWTGVVIRWAILTAIIIPLMSLSVTLMVWYLVCPTKREKRTAHQIHSVNAFTRRVMRGYAK